MTKTTRLALVASVLLAGGCAATAEQPAPIVGGAEMLPTRNIVENASLSADHTTLVAAVQAAGLVETLQGPGPFTVLAPTDEAFEALPAGAVDTLLKPENQRALTKVLTCHVIAADVMAADVIGMIADDGGEHQVETVGGCTLTARVEAGEVVFTDEKGNDATVTIADVEQSNGVIHVVDAVLLPQ